MKRIYIYIYICIYIYIYITNDQNIGLLQRAQIEKTVHGIETHWLFGKENVPGAVVYKEKDAGSLVGHEMIHDYWFF